MLFYLISRGRVDLIVLVIVSSLFFVAFSFIVLVIQRVYTVFHPVELFHEANSSIEYFNASLSLKYSIEEFAS